MPYFQNPLSAVPPNLPINSVAHNLMMRVFRCAFCLSSNDEGVQVCLTNDEGVQVCLLLVF